MAAITFETNRTATMEGVETELREAVEQPDTFEKHGNLVWWVFTEFDHESVATLDVSAPRALVIRGDSSNARIGHLYERCNGRYVLSDAMRGTAASHGWDVVDYFRREYDIDGVHDVEGTQR